jgi:hypothetical protein
LAPIPDDVLLQAGKAMAAYNQYISFDSELARRDEALFGPDARKKLIGPIEGTAKVQEAVAAGVAKPEVAAANKADAAVAPETPDPENRASRRYSEGQKNLGRTLVGRAVTSVVGGGLATASAYKAAHFVWHNQEWFINMFADNPTMTNVLGWLLHYLKHLPLA